jgi:dolichol-phosphate mannosyltransferase
VQKEFIISVCIVIGTYNERDNIKPLLDEIFKAKPDLDILFVDDNSPDGTGQLIEEIAAADKRVRVIHRPGKMGLGSAYRTAFRQLLETTKPEYIFELDADFSHDPAQIPQFIAKIESGYDLVIGARYIPGGSTPTWNAYRKAISWSANIYARILLGWHIHDYTTGYRVYRAKKLASIDLDAVKSEGYSFQIEMAFTFAECGFKVGEVPIRFIDRTVGKSKFSRKIVFEAMFRVFLFAIKRIGNMFRKRGR